MVEEAEAAESKDPAKAIDLYKRAAVVYRISRFPFICSPLKTRAYELQKAAYLKAAKLWETPLKDVNIPHKHAAGADGKEIPLYIRIPPTATPESPCPVVLLITGLDGHRPDNTMVQTCSRQSYKVVPHLSIG